MKKINVTKWAAAIACGALMTITASAIPTQLDVSPIAPPQPVDPVNAGDATVAAWVQTLVTAYNAHLPALIPGPLPTPVGGTVVSVAQGGSAPAGFPTFGLGVLSITIPVAGFDYLALRWGGPLTADNWQAFYVGLDTSDTFTSPSGQYGLSDYRLFHRGGTVPDGGSTIAMLGFALTGVGLLRRKIAKA